MWFSSCVLASSDFGGGAVTTGGGGGAAQAARPARAAQAARTRRLFDIGESFPFATDIKSRLSRKNPIRSTPFYRMSIGRRARGEACSPPPAKLVILISYGRGQIAVKDRKGLERTAGGA
jgi:hypothetical protein